VDRLDLALIQIAAAAGGRAAQVLAQPPPAEHIDPLIRTTIHGTVGP